MVFPILQVGSQVCSVVDQEIKLRADNKQNEQEVALPIIARLVKTTLHRWNTLRYPESPVAFTLLHKEDQNELRVYVKKHLFLDMFNDQASFDSYRFSLYQQFNVTFSDRDLLLVGKEKFVNFQRKISARPYLLERFEKSAPGFFKDNSRGQSRLDQMKRPRETNLESLQLYKKPRNSEDLPPLFPELEEALDR